VRNYQIVEEEAASSQEALEIKRKLGHTEATTLVEIGPRFVLNPIRIFRGAFAGQTIYQNAAYVSPNLVRAEALRSKKRSYVERKEAQQTRQERNESIVVPVDPLDDVFK
jgi:ribosome biogenesis protein BRX1